MIKSAILALMCVIFLSACGVNEDKIPAATLDAEVKSESTAEAVYRKITADEARDIMDSGEDYILLDVRTENEYKEKRIDGAILIPDNEIADRAEQELPDKDAVILIYCRSGFRSANASKALAELGYANVHDIGGINDWPYETK